MGRRDKIVDEVLDRYPNVGNRTLARLLVEQYPELYTIEQARSAIRYRNGARGVANRKSAKVDNRKKPCTLEIPQGLRQVPEPLNFKKPGDWLFLTDLHIPYHDEVSIEAAVKFGVDNKIKNLFGLGDWVDFYRLSDYVSDPRMASPSNELDTLRKFLKSIKKYFKGERVYKVGNHEDRYERYLYQRASAVVGIQAFQLDKVLGLDELGFKYIASKQRAIVGDYNIFHGHELPSGASSPVSPAKSLYGKTSASGIVGHHHVTSNYTHVSQISKVLTHTHSIGCLCLMVKGYSPVNGWNHGFGHARVDSKGKTEFRNYVIDRGKVECRF